MVQIDKKSERITADALVPMLDASSAPGHRLKQYNFYHHGMIGQYNETWWCINESVDWVIIGSINGLLPD